MKIEIGLALLAIGAALWGGGSIWPTVSSWFSRLFKTKAAPDRVDVRADLFLAYTKLSDHVNLVGTEGQKSAMLLILPSVAIDDPRQEG